jgi:primosomal protein N'
MQYANIIVDHKAGGKPLTYEIPPGILAHLAIGSVVLVPLGGIKVHGVITQFIRNLPTDVASKLKPIDKVIYANEFVPPELLQAVTMLQLQYGYKLSDLLYLLLPTLPKRPQPPLTLPPSTHKGYKSFEYCVPVSKRCALYAKLAQKALANKQSILIITATDSAASALAQRLSEHNLPTTLYPSPHTAKRLRAYYLKALATSTPPSVYIGTRGALLTPLLPISGVIIDEPWLPGHKEERMPKLWSGVLASFLCKAYAKPLFFVSSLGWPETQLFLQPKRSKSTVPSTPVNLVPKRRLSEQVSHFLSDYTTADAKLVVIIRENPRDTYWCAQCQKIQPGPAQCPKCRAPIIVFPALNKTEVIRHIPSEYTTRVSVLSSQDILQYQTYTAILVLGFDVFLSIIDYRASAYLLTLLSIIRSQAANMLFATANPDPWTALLNKPLDTFYTQELPERKNRLLPPFGLPVQFTAQKMNLLENFIKDNTTSPLVLRLGTPQSYNDGYKLTLLLKPNASIPPKWHKNGAIKIDILPHYIE